MKLAKSKLTEAQAVRRGSKIGLIMGGVLTLAWLVALGVMLVSFGAWGWVVWPAIGVTWARWMTSGAAQAKKQIAEVDAKVASVVK